ncbi:DUF2975 domain-containing protein [uncultured Ruthenibacterium sp.]|uniref:DUF2975 domain-containing protein n=1 Tax=uncultured Ruthenibacterium sp. TaxID=1905347 RepID=UPI00349EE8F0
MVQRWMNESFARAAARVLKGVCWLVMGFYVLCLVLSILGRQTFVLHTSTGTYDRAIYAEENHEPASRGLTVGSSDNVYVRANDEDGIDWVTQMGLSLMYAVHVLPLIAAYWLLSRVLANVQAGRIFAPPNDVYLLGYGALQCAVAVLVPVLKMLICQVCNLFSKSQISIGISMNLMGALFPGVAFLVAAYILHYGMELQDEVDHTL